MKAKTIEVYSDEIILRDKDGNIIRRIEIETETNVHVINRVGLPF